MRPYEVMVIFDIGLEEGDIRQRVDRVHELVRSKGGIPGSVSTWGRRTFAYEIKHRTEGYYVVLEATAEPATMSEVDRYLALEDAVLRHKVIRQPDHVAGRAAAKPRRRPAPRPEASRAGGAATTVVASTAPPAAAATPVGATAAGAGSQIEGGTDQAPIAAVAAENAGADTAKPSGDAAPAAS
jgi:small subunit ribosomal protein S6